MAAGRTNHFHKILFIGECGVGKTSLAYASNLPRLPFEEHSPSETYEGVSARAIKLANGIEIKFSIHDLAGKKKYSPDDDFFNKIAFSKCMAIFIVYDLANLKSFNEVEFWVKKARQLSPASTLVLIGNKLDLKEKREVTPDQIKQKAIELQIDEALCFELSAKDMIWKLKESYSVIAEKINQIHAFPLQPQVNETLPNFPTLQPKPAKLKHLISFVQAHQTAFIFGAIFFPLNKLFNHTYPLHFKMRRC